MSADRVIGDLEAPNRATGAGCAAVRGIPFVVAIDGLAGSGKSSVSREVAARLGFGVLDTGAVYRAFAWHASTTGVDFTDEHSLLRSFDRFNYRVNTDPAVSRVGVGEQDVSHTIRTPEVTALVARVAPVASVRARLVQIFRDLIVREQRPGIVVEGRDITSVVAQDAPVRILLAASEPVRIARRAGEAVGTTGVRSTVAAALRVRDEGDAQRFSLEQPADGIHLIDSTELDFEQTVTAVLGVIIAARESADSSAPHPTTALSNPEETP